MKTIKATVEVTYKEYRLLLANVAGEQIAFEFTLPTILTKLSSELKEFVTTISKEFGASVKDIVACLMNRDIFNLLKAVRFNLRILYRAINAFTSLIHRGFLLTLKQFANSPLFQQLKDGVIKIDQVLEKHPILKRLTGLALSGFLLWAWCHMAFTGHFESDFDLTSVVTAFQGKFQLVDLMNESGLELIALLCIGLNTATGLGIVWIGETTYNLVLALVLLGAKQANKTRLASILRQGIKKQTRM